MIDYSDRNGDWIITYTGKRFYPLDPRPEDIDIIDIAHALAMCNRFAGHTIFPYSVADHSVACSKFTSKTNSLRGLLHDASEAYICDIPRPVKRFLNDYKSMENKIMEVIGDKYNLGEICRPEVKNVDNRLLVTEALSLCTNAEWALGSNYPDPYDGSVYKETHWLVSMNSFLNRFQELADDSSLWEF